MVTLGEHGAATFLGFGQAQSVGNKKRDQLLQSIMMQNGENLIVSKMMPQRTNSQGLRPKACQIPSS